MEDIRVLVVDDEAFNFEMLKVGLGDVFNLTYASSGQEALTMSLRESPQIVLLDICMPGLDGYDTCRLLKNTPETANIPIILLSGLESDNEVKEGYKAGCDDYITKPFEMAELVNRIKSLSTNKG